MVPTPYLFFNGDCAEAIAFYAEVFGGEIIGRMPASELPAEFAVPEDRRDWVMHSTIKIGNGQIMASDNIMGTSDKMAGASVSMIYSTAAEAKAIYDRLADGGEIQMPFSPTFWSAGFGTLTDRFGIKWMVGTDQPPSA